MQPVTFYYISSLLRPLYRSKKPLVIYLQSKLLTTNLNIQEMKISFHNKSECTMKSPKFVQLGMHGISAGKPTSLLRTWSVARISFILLQFFFFHNDGTKLQYNLFHVVFWLFCSGILLFFILIKSEMRGMRVLLDTDLYKMAATWSNYLQDAPKWLFQFQILFLGHSGIAVPRRHWVLLLSPVSLRPRTLRLSVIFLVKHGVST